MEFVAAVAIVFGLWGALVKLREWREARTMYAARCADRLLGRSKEIKVVGKPGSFWVENKGWHYIDQDGIERVLVGLPDNE